MQEFTPGTAYAQLYRRRYVVALIGLFAGVMAILLLFNNTSGDTDNALYGVVTMGVIFAVLVRRVLGRPARLVEGQRLIVSGSELTLKRRTIEPITLRADDIRDIRKTGKRRYVVFGKQAHVHLYLSPFAENPAALEAALGLLRPVSTRAYPPGSGAFRVTLLLVWFATLLPVLSPAIDDMPLVITAAVVNCLLSVWVFVRGRLSVNLSKKIKAGVPLVWLVVALMVTVTVMKGLNTYR